MLVSIDPNTKKLAYAIGDYMAKRGGFLTGELPLAEPDRDRRVQEFCRALVAMKVRHMAYESPYLGMNPKTFGLLSALMGKVEGMAMANGLEFIPIPPTTWQSACLRQKGCGALKREQLKLLSITYASDVLGAHPGTEDLADAICLHRYVGTNMSTYTKRTNRA